MKKLTKEEFVVRAHAKHGDKYGYDKVVYINMYTRVKILCNKHGVFEQTPSMHLSGHGCGRCKGEASRKCVCGVAFNDYDGFVTNGKVKLKSYELWLSMIKRCYSEGELKKHPSYKDCYVCNEWLYYSNFKKWFEEHLAEYKDKYQLDKDILIKGNKVYSPETCCFVPPIINTILTNSKAKRGQTGIVGVYKRGKKFFSSININGRSKKLGSFNTQQEAFLVYKETKEKRIRSLAKHYYENKCITKRVYDALMSYEIKITD